MMAKIMPGNSLRTRVMLSLLCLSLVPVLAVSYQGYHCGRMAVSELMRLHVQSVAESRAVMIAAWLDELSRNISTLVHLPVVVRSLEARENSDNPEDLALLEGVIESFSAFGEQYESMTIFDADWNALATSSRGDHHGAEFDSAAFRSGVVSASGVFFDTPHPHPHDANEIGSHFGSAIRSPSGVLVGYLVANINFTASLTPLLQNRSGLWKTGKAFVVDTSGHPITQPLAGGVSVEFAPLDELLSPVRARTAPAHLRTYKDFRGVEVVGVAHSLSFQDWMVVVEIDIKEAMAWVVVLMQRAALMVLLSLIAVVIVSIWLSGVLGAPLARLAAVAHRIAQGHSNERLGPMKLKEADDVRQAFNNMLDELGEKEKEIVRTATLATVGELTSRVVHEMRNPLSSIKMNIQSFLAHDAHDDQNRELSEIAMEQVNRLETMLNELLQYGRPLTLSTETVEMHKVVLTAIDAVASASQERDVSISLTDSVKVGLAEIDVEQMQRALTNLLANAIAASLKGGAVEVGIEPSVEYRNGVQVTVSDQGVGIRPGNLEKLFLPFFTTKPDGVGLGLANVKKIAGLHGGSVRVKNRDGGGAAFTIDLPPAWRSRRRNLKGWSASEVRDG